MAEQLKSEFDDIEVAALDAWFESKAAAITGEIQNLGKGPTVSGVSDIRRRMQEIDESEEEGGKGESFAITAIAAQALATAYGRLRGEALAVAGPIAGFVPLDVAAEGGLLGTLKGLVANTVKASLASIVPAIIAQISAERARFEAFRKDKGIDAFTEASRGIAGIKIPILDMSVELLSLTFWDETQAISGAIWNAAKEMAVELNLNPLKDINNEIQRRRTLVPQETLVENLDIMRNRFFRELGRDGEAIGGWKKQGVIGG